MPSAQGVRSTEQASWGCSAPRICLVSRNGVSSGMGKTWAPVPKEYLHEKVKLICSLCSKQCQREA